MKLLRQEWMLLEWWDVFEKVQNLVEKTENASNQHFFLSLLWFLGFFATG